MCFLHSFLLSCDIHKYSAKNIWERLDIDPTLRVYQPGHNLTTYTKNKQLGRGMLSRSSIGNYLDCIYELISTECFIVTNVDILFICLTFLKSLYFSIVINRFLGYLNGIVLLPFTNNELYLILLLYMLVKCNITFIYWKIEMA